MLIPLGTDRYKQRAILVTYVLIALNIVAFVGLQILAQREGQTVERIERWAVLVPGHSGWWTYLTYAFLHADLAHILFNMLALWVFGPDVEDRLGRMGFLALYVAGAVGAGAAHGLFENSGVIGASGAVAAVTGAFLVLFPRVRVRTLVFFFIIGMFHIPAWWYILFLIGGDLVMSARGGGAQIAHAAHLGGYLLGVAVPLALLATKIIPREPYDLFTMGRQAARRRAFKAVQQKVAQGTPVARKPGDAEVKRPATAAAKARLRVQELLAVGDLDGAADAYLEMVGKPGAGSLPPLGRRPLYEVANHLFAREDYTNAAEAYRRFLAAYEADPEAPRVLLMLGLIYVRYLNDPIEGRRVLTRAAERLGAEEDEQLARDLLEELG